MSSSSRDSDVEDASAAQARLIAALRHPAVHGLPPDAAVDVIETHISYVILAGGWAYKIKKPLDLGFLDFRSLARRRHFCEEEVRLNSRLAPSVYVDVVTISGEPSRPVLVFGDSASPLEYAVRMRRFPQSMLFGRMLVDGRLRAEHIDELARLVARFHGTVASAQVDGPYGHAGRVGDLAFANLDAVASIASGLLRETVDHIREWTTREQARLADVFERRLADGRVRECHGDLHLGNIALVDGVVTVFDCIEFNDAMRWVDVLSEVAFTVMDLEDRGSLGLAYRYLNAYLEESGDYDGLQVLPFYLVYRAMVRAKIAALRIGQVVNPERLDALRDECSAYVRLAARYAAAQQAGIVAMHGFSGSGKSTLAAQLVEHVPAIRVRTDVERRRIRTRSETQAGHYSADETATVYAAVEAALTSVVTAGFVAVADGAFLQRSQRDQMRQLAARLGVAYVQVVTEAPLDLLRRRVAERQAAGHDASEADVTVLERQLSSADRLDSAERAESVVSNPATAVADVVANVKTRLAHR